MHIFLVARTLLPTDGWMARWAVFVTGSPVIHVELIVPRPCAASARRACELCGRTTRVTRGPTQTHLVGYVVYNVKEAEFRVVHRSVDKVFKENAVQRIRIELERGQYNVLVAFLEEQLGKPFNTWGYRLNFWTKFRIGQKAYGVQPAKSWFCSELATAALQHINVLAKTIDPCKVSPGLLIRTFDPNSIRPQLIVGQIKVPLEMAITS